LLEREARLSRSFAQISPPGPPERDLASVLRQENCFRKLLQLCATLCLRAAD
jgi:hypothetical protein